MGTCSRNSNQQSAISNQQSAIGDRELPACGGDSEADESVACEAASNPVGPGTRGARDLSKAGLDFLACSQTASQPGGRRRRRLSEMTPARLTAPPSTRERPQ